MKLLMTILALSLFSCGEVKEVQSESSEPKSENNIIVSDPENVQKPSSLSKENEIVNPTGEKPKN